MHYNQSQQILKEINKAKKILLNCHRNPDPDSIGSALAMRLILKKMNKEVKIICPSKEIFENVDYLNGYKTIDTGINFGDFDYSNFDLFITLDSSSWDMVTNSKKTNLGNIEIIVIDHHETNDLYGKINLVDKSANSVCEMLYFLFSDWNFSVSKDIANCLMAGIVGDTGAFRYPNLRKEVFLAVYELIGLGADKDLAIHRIYRSEPFNLLKFYGEILSRLEIDKERKFVWSIISYEIYSKLDKPSMAKESAASMFAQVVEDTDFGFIAVEMEPKKLAVSFRSRNGFDTSKIALQIGGGGHVYASGGKIEGMELEDAKAFLLKTVRRIVDEEKS